MKFLAWGGPLRHRASAQHLPKPHRTALFAALALAGAAQAATLDFNQCVELALKQNPGLAATGAQIDQAQAAVAQAQGNRLPKITLSLNGVHTNDALNAFGLKLSQRNASFGDFGFGEFLQVFSFP